MIEMTEVRLSSSCRGGTLIFPTAIRQTLHFYAQHLRQSTRTPPSCVLLTDDRRNREKAVAEGMTAMSAKEYVDGLAGDVRKDLVDLVVGGVDEIDADEEPQAARIYPEVRLSECMVELTDPLDHSTYHRTY